ncbi:MAG: hypothetical protein WD604_05430 [Balneolaceae bacterium]
MKHPAILKNENGSTLIETLVATAILVSVLLPVSMFLGYAANNPQNEEKILALGLAQAEMEKVLSEKSYTGFEKEIDDRWLVTGVITKDDNLVQVGVSVYRKNKQKPVITLTTERLLYEADFEK